MENIEIEFYEIWERIPLSKNQYSSRLVTIVENEELAIAICERYFDYEYKKVYQEIKGGKK